MISLRSGALRLAVLAAAVTVAIALAAADAGAEKPKTLAYDGFNTGTGAGSYKNHIRLRGSVHRGGSGAPTLGTIGFGADHQWTGSTSHLHTRSAATRELKHDLLKSTQPGCLGHWTFNGTRTVRRNLPKAPVAASGVYTLCLLIKAWDHPACNEEKSGNHTTGWPGAYGMIGFTPDNPGIYKLAIHGDNGSKGLSLGYYEDDLRAFAGGKSFTILEGYKENTTYLLMAEMAVSAKGPEYIRGFYAAEGDKKLTPAKFNSDNAGKGVQVETWASAADMIELELFMADVMLRPGGEFLPQASVYDRNKNDFITWDEVRLLDGRATVPIGGDVAETQVVAAQAENKTLVAAKTLPAKLVAYWAFDEGKGESAKEPVSNADGKLLRATWIGDGRRGSALHFTTKVGWKAGPHSSSTVSIPHETAVKAGFPWERHHKFTFTAWVRGEGDFKGKSDIITKANSGRTLERRFADIKGIAFLVCKGKLQLELINSVNYPQKDNRITARGKLDVPGNGKWHHVAVTYDGSSKSAGVSFYVDGVRDEGFSLDFAKLPGGGHFLTADIGVLSPLCIGGRDCTTLEDPITALAADYAMAGDIDEVGIFSYALSAGGVIAIHSLAEEKGLNYNLNQVNQLIELHKSKKGSVKIGEKTWRYVASGLSGDLGKVAKSGGKFSVKLSADGSGVAGK